MANTETELKLSCRPEDMDALLSHPLLRTSAGRKPAARRQISRYFDTADDALAKAGLSLRVRTIGRKYIQTVKTKGTGGAGFSARGEWEAPITGDMPNPELIAEWGLAGDFTKATGGRPLDLRFETDVRRATRVILRPEGEVEIAVDRGVVRAAGKEDPINEVELELRYGDPALLHDIALELLADLPLGLGGPSKAARGYHLLGHAIQGADPMRAEPVALKPDMPTEEAFHAIGLSCLGHLVANIPVVEAGTDPEGVHQARVAIRRLKSAMSAFRAMVAGPDTDRIKDELRWLMSILGPARDSDVFGEEVLPTLATSLDSEPGWAELTAHFAREREVHARQAREAMASGRFTALVIALSRWLERGEWRRDPERAPLRGAPLGDTARAVLRKRTRAVLKGGRGFDDLPEETRHGLRVLVKKLRYSLDFLAPLYPAKRLKPALKTLKRLQEILGQSNDITVGRAKLREAARMGGPGAPMLAFVAGWAASQIDGDRSSMEGDARAAWAAFAALEPIWELGDTPVKDEPVKAKKAKKK